MVLNMRIQCRSFALWLVIFLMVFWSSASLAAAGDNAPSAQSIRRDVEKEALQEAMNAFNARDYERAKIGFEILSESSQNPDIARQALFGLASAKLMLANTTAEYEDAISNWKKWSDEVNSRQECEDPRMITPFLLRLLTSIKSPGGIPTGTKGRRSAREIDSRLSLQTKEKEMQTLRTKLDMREREIRRLRHQLESIEEIHRKYQEKKQESNP